MKRRFGMKSAIFGRLSILVMVVFLLGACSAVRAMEIGQDAKDFTLKSVDGADVKLSDFKGKVIILDFFASWCPPCRGEIPDFIELQKTYGDQGFSMIGVAVEGMNDARAFAQKMGMNYPVLVDDNAVSADYGPVRSIPTTFVIDKNFKIAKMYIGFKKKDVFEADIKELLK